MSPKSCDIAIIGIGCRFPGAKDVHEYWENLKEGRESITFFTDEELLAAGVNRSQLDDPNYVRAAPIIADVDKFDAGFFDFSPREACLMDPQQRMLLETSWNTFEDAGYDVSQLTMPVAVFAGSGGVVSSYLVDQLKMGSGMLGPTGSLQHIGNDKDFIATRISYKLNLTGPSVSVQTACSTSMVALHLACMSLQNGESDMALAGASTVRCPHIEGYVAREGDILSSDGHCRAFDENADGTVFGSGVGAVLLKPLEKAQKDRDHIYAVIKSTAINNDGANKVSYTASSVEGQAKAMVEAITLAGVSPEAIGMIECHGTGTIVGDPLEIQALTMAAKHLGVKSKGFCAVGSVKTNIGHLEQTAGMASLIKTVLCLEKGKLVPSINFKKANRKIRFRNSPFYLNTQLKDWENELNAPRVACVNSLGLGGSNGFAVLEQAPPLLPRTSKERRDHHILTVSAKNHAALRQRVSQYLPYLEDPEGPPFADICFTANVGRSPFGERFSAVVRSRTDAIEALTGFLKKSSPSEKAPCVNDSPVIFVFPGQGSQHIGMARELYETHPSFKATIDECDDLLAGELDVSLCELLFEKSNEVRVHQTGYAQPVLYAIGVALDRLWRSWGVVPVAVMGHSVGEYAAATSANMLSLEDGIKLISARARLMQSLPQGGAMASILAEQAVVEEMLDTLDGDEAVIASINAREAMVVSGSKQAVATIVEQCTQRGINSKMLSVSHAFHSKFLDPILEEFESIAAEFDYQRPSVGFISNLTGQIMYQAPDATYWRNHARQAVRFASCVNASQEYSCTIYLELGSGRTLSSLIRANKPGAKNLLCLPSLIYNKQEDWQTMLTSLAALYRAGVSVDWEGFDEPFQRTRLSLPTYPFQRSSYWYENTENFVKRTIPQGSISHPLLGEIIENTSADRVYRQTYNLNQFGFLDHHRVHGLPILPFAAALEVISAAGGEYFEEPVSINNITYQKALTVDNRIVEISLVVQSPNKLAFEFTSSATDNPRFMEVHLQGVLTRGVSTRIETDPLLPDKLIADAPSINPTLFYDRIDTLGLNYGPLFQGGIKALWQWPDEVITRVSLHGDLNPAGYGIHPALLDACLHLFPALAPEYGDFQDLNRCNGPSYLPVSLEAYSLNQVSTGSLWVRAFRRKNESSSDRMLVDIQLFTDVGLPLGVLSGLELQKIDKAVLETEDYLPDNYRLEWTELPTITPQIAENIGKEPVGWIIVADSAGVGSALRQQLIVLGDEVRLISTAEFRDFGAGDWNGILSNAWSSMQVPCENIIFLAGVDDGDHATLTTETIIRSQDAIVQNALKILQAAIDLDELSARIWLVTRNAIDAGIPSKFPCSPSQAALWGFARSVAEEMPSLWGGIIDLPKLGVDVPLLDAKALFSELTSSQVEDQIVIRPEARYGPRLNRIPKIDSNVCVIDDYEGDASYLITGGLGGLGLQVAKWLWEEHSAANLVLMSRNAANDVAKSEITKLEKSGCVVTVMQGDVCKEADVIKVLALIEQTLPTLRGIVHCAGGLGDGVISGMSWADFTAVTDPKTLGAWNLHHYSAELPLDIFILFSSMLSITGSAGQSNYATGNAFLDGLGATRKMQGMPATVINWGPWSDIGMAIVSGDRGEKIWNRRGVRYIAPEQGLEHLNVTMNMRLDQTTIMMVDWQVYAKQFDRVPPIYSGLMRRSPTITSAEGTTADSHESLNEMSADERRKTLTSLIHTEVCSVLGLCADELSEEQALDEWGLDSLMTVELINRLHNRLPVLIPRAIFVAKPSVKALVDAAASEFGDTGSNSEQSESDGDVPPGSWLHIRRPRPNARIKLVCFAFAGGGPSVFNDWADKLPESIEVAAVHLPGRGSRLSEKPLKRVSEMVDQMMAEFVPYLDKPFALFGHCLGAVIMYEAASRLEKKYKLQAQHLFASGAGAPDIYTIPAHFETNEDKLLDLLRLVDFAATEGLIEDEELRALAFPVLRADLEAAAFYTEEVNRKASALAVPMTAFGGWQDMYAAPHGIDAWRRFTSKSFNLQMRIGNHYFLETERDSILEVVSKTLESQLDNPGTVASLASTLRVDDLWQQSEAVRADAFQLPELIYPVSESTKKGWLQSFNPDKTTELPVLMCFPPAWVDGFALAEYIATYAQSMETVMVTYPGRGSLLEQKPYSDIGELANNIERQLEPWRGRRLIFFGHCMGAIVAFETARRLRKRSGFDVAHLFVSGATSPETFVYPWVHLQPDAKIKQLMRSIDYPGFDRIDGKMATDAGQRWMAMLRADFKAQSNYRYVKEPPLDLPITAVSRREDYWTSPFSMQLWKNHTHSDFKEILQPGGHFDFKTWLPETVERISNSLKKDLEHVIRICNE